MASRGHTQLLIVLLNQLALAQRGEDIFKRSLPDIVNFKILHVYFAGCTCRLHLQYSYSSSKTRSWKDVRADSCNMSHT